MDVLESLVVHAIIGAVLGALTGIACLMLLVLPSWPDSLSKVMIFAVVFGPTVGAPLGAVAAPILGWFVLRRVPIRHIVLIAPLGTLCGAFLALLGGWLAADITDGRGIFYLVSGGVGGVVISAFALRARYSDPMALNPMW